VIVAGELLGQPGWLPGGRSGCHADVLVVAGRAQLGRQGGAELLVVQVVVAPGPQHGGHPGRGGGKALAHPLRHRILLALTGRSATISQLSVALRSGKGTIAFHLRVLRDAGLVRVAELRQVRGGTEVHYRRTGGIRVDAYDPAGAHALLRAVGEEMADSPSDPLVLLRTVRLTDAQARQLADALGALLAGQPEGDGARHTVLVTMVRAAAAPG
jgi:DNA-binding transcriptional ArsR family regulator